MRKKFAIGVAVLMAMLTLRLVSPVAAASPGSLTIVSVAPESTVKYTTKQESPTRIEVFFVSSAGVSIKFHADVIDGRIVTSVMNEPGPRIGGHTKREDDHDGDRDEGHDEDHESGEHDDD